MSLLNIISITLLTIQDTCTEIFHSLCFSQLFDCIYENRSLHLCCIPGNYWNFEDTTIGWLPWRVQPLRKQLLWDWGQSQYAGRFQCISVMQAAVSKWILHTDTKVKLHKFSQTSPCQIRGKTNRIGSLERKKVGTRNYIMGHHEITSQFCSALLFR